jgi:endothelin-converting enzyme
MIWILQFIAFLDYAQAEAMINEVRDAFKSNLQNLTWMDNETRDAAESKADAITDMIGEFLYGTKSLELHLP